jgi:hypothetical protein
MRGRSSITGNSVPYQKSLTVIEPRPVHVEFLVDLVALGDVFSLRTSIFSLSVSLH